MEKITKYKATRFNLDRFTRTNKTKDPLKKDQIMAIVGENFEYPQ